MAAHAKGSHGCQLSLVLKEEGLVDFRSTNRAATTNPQHNLHLPHCALAAVHAGENVKAQWKKGLLPRIQQKAASMLCSAAG